jgi:hypothetical protein
MKRFQNLMIVLVLINSFWGCNRANNEANAGSPSADSISNRFVSSSAAVETGKDSTRKFIRTADLKFKVKSVIQSTYDIENIANRQDGFVIYTNLASNIDNTEKTQVSADSSIETTFYTVTNTITLRVPNTKLDTTLKEIAKNIDYLDYRIIKAEDVALQILSNNLTEKRNSKNEERLSNAIDNKGKKLTETTVAEEILLSKKEEADNAKISNLSLQDQIKFSTINLSLYQPQTLKRELVFNNKAIDAYEPGFGSKMLEAMKYGVEILESFIISIIKLWVFILLALVIYLMYKKYYHQIKK